jgi:hypothetical protein
MDITKNSEGKDPDVCLNFVSQNETPNYLYKIIDIKDSKKKNFDMCLKLINQKTGWTIECLEVIHPNHELTNPQRENWYQDNQL